MVYIVQCSELFKSITLTVALTGLAIGLLSYTLILVIYRLYFHPLASVPGPFLARVTDWYNVAVAWGNDRHLDFYKLHQQYGPIVRYGPSRVSVNSAAGLAGIYGMKSNVQKSSYYSIFSHYFEVPCVMTSITHKEHAPKRKFVSQAFSDSAIHAMEEHVLMNVRKFCDILSTSKEPNGSWSKPFNVSQWTNYLTFDIMSTLCFSDSYGMLTSSKQHWMVSVMQKATQGLNVVGHMQWIAKLYLDRLIFSKLAAANDRFQNLSKKMALKRYEMTDVKVKDAFYFLQSAQDPITGARLTQEELVAEAALLIVAGSDTTATAMTSTMFYLLMNPKCLHKVQQEVRSKFTEVEQIRGGAALTSCTYLRACIDEAFRMTPGVGGILPREVLPGGLVIDDTVFPAGVDVGVPIYALHHNEDCHPQPFEYIPERWIVDSNAPRNALQSPEAVALARSAFCPFGGGAWGCVGKGLAYKEIMMIVARLVWLFDWKIAPGTHTGGGDPSLDPETLRHRPNELQGNDMFVLAVDGPIVQFRQRAEAMEKA